MNQRSTVTPTPAQEQAALAWLSLLHDQPSSGDQATFSQWLQADPAHVEAYARVQVLWELSEQPARTLAAEEDQALQGLLRQMDGARGRARRRWSVGLALAASLLLAVTLGAGWQPGRWVDDLGADYVSAPGQVRTVTLADASQVTLDADSAIAVDFSHGQRHVQLRRGAAFFQVSHTGESFVVSAEQGEARVLGTQFEVRLQPQAPRSRCCPDGSGSRRPRARPSKCLAPASKWPMARARPRRCMGPTAKRNWPGARVG
ncbi:hypothetical protein P308_04985 [Pseudomonas piscis]|nr:hypothetical protein P308_04985 [Pseudomonas piscis]